MLSGLRAFVCACSFVQPAIANPTSPTPGAPPTVEAPAQVAPKDAARAAFERAVALAELGQYVEAKAGFLEAYRLVPHPIVAYNAALSCLALGEKEEARELIERALAAGEGELTDAERAAILAARSDLNAASSPPTALAPVDRRAPEPAAEAAPPGVARSLPPPPVATSSPAPASRQDRRSATLGYVVGAAGAALLLGSGALYLWNDGRHDAWSTENAALERDRDALLAASRIPSRDSELKGRAEANDRRWASIQLVDTASVTMLAGGLVALGVGAYLALTRDAVLLGSRSPGRFDLTYTF